MSSLAAIQKQIASLEAEAARILKADIAAAVAKARELIQAFGLTAQDLGLGGARGKRGAVKGTRPKRADAGAAKYADPKTGKTWSGYGRIPAWIANARNRDAFLVDKSGAGAAPAKAAASGSKATRKTA